MTRKEEIKEMARTTASHITSDKDMQVAFADTLRRGAEWADANPNKDNMATAYKVGEAATIDKACEWLEKKAILYVRKNCEQGEHSIHKTMLEDFRKAMKGGEG